MYTKDLNVRLNLRITEEDLSSLNDICDINGISLNYLIRYILRKYIRECNQESEVKDE